jgi:hypothetical protein
MFAEHLDQIVGSIFCHIDHLRSAGVRIRRCRHLYCNLSTDVPQNTSRWVFLLVSLDSLDVNYKQFVIHSILPFRCTEI